MLCTVNAVSWITELVPGLSVLSTNDVERWTVTPRDKKPRQPKPSSPLAGARLARGVRGDDRGEDLGAGTPITRPVAAHGAARSRDDC